MRIFVDLDGVLCDIKSAYREVLEGPLNELEKQFPQSRIGLFANLKPMDGAIEAMKILQENHDVWILSRPSYKNINCYSEKAEWVLNNLGYEMQKKMILCGNKSLIKGNHNGLHNVLIDDMTMDRQIEFDGIFIHFGTEKFPDWNAVLIEIEHLNKLATE